MYVKIVLFALFCGVAASQANPDTPATDTLEPVQFDAECHDKLGYEKCRSYGKTSCFQIYEAWARENCAEFCGYCKNPDHTSKPCVDNLNCASYPAEICTNADYRIWTEDHCCAFCRGGGHTATEPQIPVIPTHSGVCDNLIDCDVYEDSACVGVYTPWAYAKCPLRCGYCPNPEPCFDKIDYCNQYTAEVCTQQVYRIWARRNCRQFCGICYNQTNLFTPGTGTYIEPTVHPHEAMTIPPYTGPIIVPTSGPGMVIASQHTFLVEGPPAALPDMCMYKGNTYKLNERWNDGCNYVCSCFDTTTNRMICTDRCSNWDIHQNMQNCSLVQEPGECCKRLECVAQ